jgi:hypothetical protein
MANWNTDLPPRKPKKVEPAATAAPTEPEPPVVAPIPTPDPIAEPPAVAPAEAGDEQAPEAPEVDWHRPIEPGEEIELPPADLTGHRTDLDPQRCKLCARPYKPGYLLQVLQGGFCWTCKRRLADEVPTDKVWKGNLRAEWEEFERYVRQAQLELCDTDLDKEQDFSFGDYGIIRCTERVRRAAMLYGIDLDPRYIEGKTKVPIWRLLALNAGEDTPSKFPHMVQYFTEKHVLLGRSRRLREMRRIDPPKDPSKLVDYNIELGKLEDAILKMRPRNPIETAAQQSAIRDMLPSNKTVLEFTKEAAGRALRYALGMEPRF